MNIKLIPSFPIVQIQMSVEEAKDLREILGCISGGFGKLLSFDSVPDVESITAARELLMSIEYKLEEVLDI